MTTARTIIKRAMQVAGILVKGEAPSADEADDGLTALNMMLSGWSNDSGLVYARAWQSFALVGGPQQLLDAFDFGGFSPSVSFMMMPIHADLLRLQAIEFNDQIRKSHYSFELHGDDIKFYPVPTAGTGSSASSIYYTKVWIEYIFEEDKSKDAILFGNTALLNNVVSDASNIPYTYQTYGTINDMGRSWIIKYGIALAKEMLGFVRSKYSSIPIPNGEVSLNGSDLISQGQSEKDSLITQLREFLDKLTKENMMTRQNAESTQLNELLAKVPLKIYVG